MDGNLFSGPLPNEWGDSKQVPLFGRDGRDTRCCITTRCARLAYPPAYPPPSRVPTCLLSRPPGQPFLCPPARLPARLPSRLPACPLPARLPAWLFSHPPPACRLPAHLPPACLLATCPLVSQAALLLPAGGIAWIGKQLALWPSLPALLAPPRRSPAHRSFRSHRQRWPGWHPACQPLLAPAASFVSAANYVGLHGCGKHVVRLASLLPARPPSPPSASHCLLTAAVTLLPSTLQSPR